MRVAARLSVAAFVIGLLLSATQRPIAGAAKWDPIDPKELAETTPKVEKDADAEVLLWSVRVSDHLVTAREYETIFEHHLRIKIFTDRGRDAQGRVDLQHADWVHINDIEARSIRRDGTFAELRKADIYERTIAKAGGAKVKSTSFVLPPVETGGIIEYRWKERREDSIADNLRLAFSRDIPVRFVRYRLVPLNFSASYGIMQGQAFQTNPTLKLTTEGGYTVVSMENVPAHRDEPHAPSDWDTEPWMLIYYGYPHPKDPDAYWLPFGKGLAASTDQAMSPTPEIRRAVASLGLNQGTVDQKIAALVAFCRQKVKRVDADTATEADRKGFGGNKTFTAALAAGRGTGYDRLGLFVAMARAADLDARVTLLPWRDDVTLDRSLMLAQLMRGSIAAVRDGDRWRFVDPRSDFVPAGHIPWTAETVQVLIADPNALRWATTPPAPPEWSLRSRTGTFRVAEDGTLEGDVTAELSGHLAIGVRQGWHGMTQAAYEAALKDAVTSRLSGAEVSGARFENLDDLGQPYAERYHLKVAGYAQRTGSRLFVQPAVFQKGIAPEFPAAGRRHPVSFNFAWKEVDRIRIDLPDGYQVESANASPEASYRPYGGCTIRLLPAPDGRSVEMTREFFFGGGSRLLYSTDTYPSLKRFFDEVARLDGFTLTLRKAAGAGDRP